MSSRHPLAELVERVLEVVRPAIEKIAELWEEITEALTKQREWETARKESLAPLAPNRVDTRHVSHTSTKPPRPTRIYRRRTP